MSGLEPSESELETAERALALAGADAQVTVVRERSLTARFARSLPTQATAVDDVGVEILCEVDGHTALSATNSLDSDTLRATAARARAGAERAARLAGHSGAYPGLAAPAPVHPVDGFDPETDRLDAAMAGRALREAFGASGAGLEAFGIWTAGSVSTAIASTTGLRREQALTDAHMRVTCRDPAGRSGFASQTASATAALRPAELAQRATAKVDRRLPAELAAGEYPVVLEADAVATMLDFLGDLAFNGLAHAEGRGALSGRLGRQVAAANVNLADAPRYPGALPRSFDAEGTPKAPLPLIQDGVAQRVVHDIRSAARAADGSVSTGHALAAGGSPHGPAPTNLVLLGGGCANERELAEPIEQGVYVTRLWYVNAVRERETLLTGMTRDGTFLIEDGRITRPLRDVRFTDSVLRLLAATEALTMNARLVSEAELYGRRLAYGVVCPALRAQGFRVTGTAPA